MPLLPAVLSALIFPHLHFLVHPKSPIGFDSRLFRGNPSTQLKASSVWNLWMSGWVETLVG
jgi:hypothetical protein